MRSTGVMHCKFPCFFVIFVAYVYCLIIRLQLSSALHSVPWIHFEKPCFFLGGGILLRSVLPLLTYEVYLHKLVSRYERRITYFHLFFKQESHFWKLVPEFPFILYVIQISFALWRMKLPRNAYITRNGLEASPCICSFVSRWEQSDLCSVQCFDTGSNYSEQIVTLLFLWYSASS